MKVRTLFTSLFAIVVLAIGQFSFGMEREFIPMPICEAPTIAQKDFGKITVKGAAFNPANKKEILFSSSDGCKAYNIQSRDITNKELSDNKELISYNRSTQASPYAIHYDKNTVKIIYTETKTPLYTVTHDDIIKLATFNADQTQLITVSYDNVVKISEIKKPVIIECNNNSIAINPDMACTSQFINNQINFPSLDKSSRFEFEGLSAKGCNQIIQLMALVYKKEIDQIKKLLSNLDISSLCTLAEMCDPLLIAHENIRLTDIVCKCIAHKYDPKKDQPHIKELPPYCENIVAKHRVEPCIKYIDDHIKPELSFRLDKGVSSMMDFGSNGKTAVTRPSAETAKIWDAFTGECLHTLTGHHWLIKAVAISSNGKIAVTISTDDTAKIWDVETGNCLHTLTGHTNWITSVVITSNSEMVITGSTDKTVKIWDIKTGKCLHTLTGHTGAIWSVAVSPDSTRVITGSLDKTAKIWDVQTGECLHTLTGHTNWVTLVAISSDGKIVVTGFHDKIVKIWNAQTGICLHTLTGHTEMVTSVTLSSDGKKVATISTDDTAKIWDVETGNCLHTLTEYTAKIWNVDTGSYTGHVTADSVAISLDGKRVVTGYRDGTLKIWNIDQTAKREFLNNLTIEQADILTEKVYPVIKKDKKFKPLPESEEYKILMTITPGAQKYLKDAIMQKEEIEAKKKLEKEAREARVGAQNLSGFFDKPFFHKKWL